MLIPDVNVLIYASREDAQDHSIYRDWLEGIVSSPEPFGLSELACSSFVRIVTHPGIWDPPTPVELAFEFINALRDSPNCVIVSPGSRHWDIFTELCLTLGLRGRMTADAYFAALAIESGNEWVTADRDFRRFPGLRWRHPLR